MCAIQKYTKLGGCGRGGVQGVSYNPSIVLLKDDYVGIARSIPLVNTFATYIAAVHNIYTGKALSVQMG